MPLDYAQAGAIRIKAATSPGTFEDDPDITDPTVALPVPLVSGETTTTFAWRLANRETSKVKVKVTFRKDDNTEVAGTFTVNAFAVLPAATGVRPAVEDHGAVDGTSAVPLIFDELGPYDTFGLILTDITAALATHAEIHVEELL